MHPLLPTRVVGNGLWLNGAWSKINVLRGRGMARASLKSFALPHPSFTTSHGIANVFETSFMSPVYILNFQPLLRFVFAFIVFFYFSVHLIFSPLICICLYFDLSAFAPICGLVPRARRGLCSWRFVQDMRCAGVWTRVEPEPFEFARGCPGRSH